MKHARRIAVIGLALALSACAATLVQPWQKRALAMPAMRLDGNRLHAHYQYQLYASREAASGGDTVGRGGCGCN